MCAPEVWGKKRNKDSQPLEEHAIFQHIWKKKHDKLIKIACEGDVLWGNARNMVALEDKRQHFTKHGDISENMTTFKKRKNQRAFSQNITIFQKTQHSGFTMTFQRRRHITKHDTISEKQQLFRCPEIIVFWRISLCFVLHGHHTEKSKRAENLIWQWMSISFCVLFCVHKPFLSINGTLWRSRVNKHSYFVHTHYLPPIFTLKNRPRFASGVCHVVQSKASWAVAQRDRKSGLLLISGGERTLCWQAASWASKLSLQVLKHHRDRSLRYPEWSWRKKKNSSHQKSSE